MKRIILILCIVLIAASPLLAFEGFTDIFGPTGSEEVLASAPVSEEKRFDVGGTVSFGIEGMRDKLEATEIHTSVHGGVALDLSWNGAIVDAKANLVLNPTIENDPQWIDIFTGLSITTYFTGGRLEAGLLKKEWGSGDGVHVVDVLNAPDYRNGIVDDPLAMKMAEPMIMTTATWEDTSLEVVYKPMLIPMVAAEDPNDRWSMLSDAQKAMMAPPTVLHQPTAQDLATLSHSQYGARLTSILGPADVGLIYWNGFYNQPAFDLTAYNPMTSDFDITLSFTRAHLFGTEATLVAGPLTLMLEGGFWLSEDRAGTDPAKYNNKFVYLAGVGFMIPKTSAYVSLTYNGHYVLDFSESAIDTDKIQADNSSDGKPCMNILTGAIELPLARETVKVRLAGTYQVETQGYALLPSVTWSIADDLVFRAAGRLFGTIGNGSDSLFKTWATNDSLSLGISYLF
jgi:hypothetical protein